MVFRYFAAVIYDGLIIFALFFVYTAFCLFANNNQAIAVSTLWYQLSLLLILMAYYVYSLKKGGQTIGMRAWRLQIVAKEKITFLQAMGRLFLSIFTQIFRPFTFSKTERLLTAWTKTRLIKLS